LLFVCWVLLQPCGGAIPICMVEEFDLPMEIIDRRVTKMKMISPSNREVDVGKTLNEKEWIGMCRREVRRRRPYFACVPPCAVVLPDRSCCALFVLRFLPSE